MRSPFSQFRFHTLRALRTAVRFGCFWFLILGVCYSRQADSNPLINQYREAREAYAAKQYQKSAELFQGVANQCDGSELAIQCQYFSIMSNWALEPSENGAKRLSEWVEQTEAFQRKSLKENNSHEGRLLDSWLENAQLLCAKWDRQKLRFDDAERRLRNFLTAPQKRNEAGKQSAAMWLELGSLLLEQRSNYPEAEKCFEHCLACCPPPNQAPQASTKLIESKAIWGATLASWHQQKYSEAKASLAKLDYATLDENLKIQTKVFQVKLANSTREVVDVLKILEPAIQLVSTGNPQAAVIYELAMALIEAGDNSSSQQILLQLVHRFPDSPFSIEARVRLARTALDEGKWNEAIEMAGEAIQLGCPNDLMPHARLALGQAQLESGDPENALATLELAANSNALAFDLQVSIRFHLSETLYQLEKWPEAEKHWQWLQDASTKIATGSNIKPKWLPTVLLRKAEMLANKKEWGKAEEIVLAIRNDFPECNHRCEVDYLLARCLVSKAEFEAARETLRTITEHREPAAPELLARAYWMTGETFMMQRRYDEAAVEYLKVTQVPGQKYWHSASLLQLGQCSEANQYFEAATEAYTQIVEKFSDSPFASLASERLKLLPTYAIAKKTEPDSSGPKR